MRTIRENPIATRLAKSAGMREAKAGSYMVPNQRCATCLQSTRGSYHEQCRRDGTGRLLVLGERAA